MKSDYLTYILQATLQYDTYAKHELMLNYALCKSISRNSKNNNRPVRIPTNPSICTYPYRKSIPNGTIYINVIEPIISDKKESIFYRYYGDIGMMSKMKYDDLYGMAYNHNNSKGHSDLGTIVNSVHSILCSSSQKEKIE